MENTKNPKSKEEIELEQLYAKTAKKKWGALRLVAIGIFGPFIFAYLQTRGRSSVSFDYESNVWTYVILFSLFIPISCYYHFQKVNMELFEIEKKIIRARKKGNENKQESVY